MQQEDPLLRWMHSIQGTRWGSDCCSGSHLGKLKQSRERSYSISTSPSLLCTLAFVSWVKGCCGWLGFGLAVKYCVSLLGSCCVGSTLLRAQAASQVTDTRFHTLSYRECIPVRKQWAVCNIHLQPLLDNVLYILLHDFGEVLRWYKSDLLWKEEEAT